MTPTEKAIEGLERLPRMPAMDAPNAEYERRNAACANWIAAHGPTVLAALRSQAALPVAWAETRFITDRDGTPIGMDEPHVVWDKEVPDDTGSWYPLYAAPRPAVPEGWMRAIDEALVVSFVGVADPSDTFEQATKKLTELIEWHVKIATDPAVNGGYKLVPELTDEQIVEIRDDHLPSQGDSFDCIAFARAILAAAKEGSNG